MVCLLCTTYAAAGERDLIYASSNWPPYVIVERNQVVAGLEHDVAKELAHRLGLRFVSRACPWARCLRLLREGDIDLTGSLVLTEERKSFLHYLHPPLLSKTSQQIFYVRKGSKVRIERYEDLRGLSVGVVKGYNYFLPFDDDDLIDKVELKNETQMMRMLKRGRIDSLIADRVIGEYLLKQEGFEGDIEQATYHHTMSVGAYFGLSRFSSLSGRVDEFNHAMAAIEADGTLSRIRARYGVQ